MYCPSWVDKEFISNKVYILLITYIFFLFFQKTQKLDSKELDNPDFFSGLRRVYPSSINPVLKKIMSNPGKKIIINAWVLNLSDIQQHLEKSLENSKSYLDFIILNPESKYVEIRADELEFNKEEVINSINNSISELKLFIKNLPLEKSTRVKIFLGDYNPKFSLYANDDNALIGFCWLNTFAIHCPHFQIKGKNGYFSSKVWDFVNKTKKEELKIPKAQKPSNEY